MKRIFSSPPRRFVRRLHRGLALLATVPLLAVAGSGILLGYYDELRYAAPPYRLAAPVAQPLSPAALAAAALTARPTARLEALYLPQAPQRSARALVCGDREGRLLLFLHPGDGSLLAVQHAHEQDLLGRLYDLHHGRLFGAAGVAIFAGAALALVLLVLTGLLLYRRPAGLHARLGAAAGVVLLYFALSGALLSYAKPLRERWYPAPPLPHAPRPAPAPAAVERALATVAAIYGPAPLERILLATPGRPMLLRFADGRRVYLDHSGRRVLRTETGTAPWLNLLYPLHSGRLLGNWGALPAAAGGGALLVVVVSGFVPPLRRKRIHSGVLRRPSGAVKEKENHYQNLLDSSSSLSNNSDACRAVRKTLAKDENDYHDQ